MTHLTLWFLLLLLPLSLNHNSKSKANRLCPSYTLNHVQLEQGIVLASFKAASGFSRWYVASQEPKPARTFLLLLLLLCGDVEPNPGPKKNSSIYPCGLCEQPVTWKTKGVACDDCSVWYHTSCTELCNTDYELLAHSNVSWICHKCDSVNCGSFTFHSYQFESPNIFSPLLNQNPDTKTTLASLDSSTTFDPIKTSSPKNNLRQESHNPPKVSSPQLNKSSLVMHTTQDEPRLCTNQDPNTVLASLDTSATFSPIKTSTPNKNLWQELSNPTEVPSPKSKKSALTLSHTQDETSVCTNPSSNPYSLNSNKSNLRILNLNAQSIRGKKSEFEALLQYTKPDVVCCTETWLHGKKPGKNHENDAILDTELIPDNYRLYRNDRNAQGGGVLILVNKNIISIEEPSYVTECELDWVKIHLKGSKELYIGCFYMPHRNISDLKELDSSLGKINNKKYRHIILCGDFNCPSINWDNHSVEHAAEQREVQQELVDLSSRHGLTQIVKNHTRQSNTLDLFFTTNSTLIKSATTLPGISDHDIVLVDSLIKPQYQQFKKRKILLWSKANWPSLKDKCIEISNNIGTTSTDQDINNMWNYFKKSMEQAITENVPSKNIVNRNSAPWLTRHLKSMIRKKAKLHKKAKETKDWTKYKQHQKECKKAFKKAEEEYLNGIIKEGLENNNNKPFWRYVKCKKQDNIGVSPLLNNGKLENNSITKANILLNQFSSVFSKPDGKIPPKVDKYVTDTLDHINIRLSGVEGLLRNIKTNKAIGPDNIPNVILKECAIELAPAITSIFQKSIDTGSLPADWRNANISPIYKKGDRNKAENYRPVSLTSVLSKLLEHIICRNMLQHFEKSEVLTHLNHGFRAGFSCETQLAVTLDDLTKNHDRDLQTDVAILDFSKAFDTVPHDKLLHKLDHYGIRGELHTWIKNFLCERKMKVVIDGDHSNETEVLSGVPQGTVLGPLLFLCHINDLPDCVTSRVRLFADDCLLYRTIKSNQDHLDLQTDLASLEKWAEDWGMKFNASKCYILSISRKSSFFYQLNNTILKEVQSNPYLGLNIANDLSWTIHINNICKKANTTLGFLRRNVQHCPKEIRLTAYLSLVRSILEYAAPIWDPSTQKDIDKIEKVQRQAARFICQDYYSRDKGCVTTMLEGLRLPPLRQRRKEQRLILTYKVANDLIPAIRPETYYIPIAQKRKIKPKSFGTNFETKNPISKYETNNSRCFQLPSTKKPNGPYSQSFFVKTIIDWNKLDEGTVSAWPLDSFKNRLSPPPI